MEEFLEKLSNYDVFNKVPLPRSLRYIVINRVGLYIFIYAPTITLMWDNVLCC
jgi:hypothetical protein